MFKKKENGFSLVELSVAAAVAIGLAVVAVSVVSGTAASVSAKGSSAASVESCTISEALAKSGGDVEATDCGVGGGTSTPAFTVYTPVNWGAYVDLKIDGNQPHPFWYYTLEDNIAAIPTLSSFDANTGVAVISYPNTVNTISIQYSDYIILYGSATDLYSGNNNINSNNATVTINSGITTITLKLQGILGANWANSYKDYLFAFTNTSTGNALTMPFDFNN
jgi:type II secretory pathway pseudopilin PulG